MTTGASRLFADLDVDVEPDAPLGPRTWFGVGGRADALVRPRSVEALQTLVGRCHRDGIELRVLGEGANLLVADEGVGGVVAHLDHPCFRECTLNRRGGVEAVRAMAGADLPKLILDSARSGLAGLEGLAGIPASIGGAVRIKAGGACGAIAHRRHSGAGGERRGEIAMHPASDLSMGYRRCRLPGPVLLWAAFRLDEGDPVELRSRVKEVFAYKRSTQPLADHSAGCMFRNPEAEFEGVRRGAGWLIDQAELKGLSVGGAEVSRQHANFFTVRPGATASDLLELSALVATRVFDRFGVRLEREVVVWSRRGVDTPSPPGEEQAS
ncbi:MAG: UDP-N-acetylmuramate dehydrogenase [Phycisphaerales bacterium]